MRFVETPIFTKVVTRLLDDDEYRSLQIALMLRPEQGPIVRGAPTERAFYMLYAYAKNEQGDLTPSQARVLGQLVREEFK